LKRKGNTVANTGVDEDLAILVESGKSRSHCFKIVVVDGVAAGKVYEVKECRYTPDHLGRYMAGDRC